MRSALNWFTYFETTNNHQTIETMKTYCYFNLGGRDCFVRYKYYALTQFKSPARTIASDQNRYSVLFSLIFIFYIEINL